MVPSLHQQESCASAGCCNHDFHNHHHDHSHHQHTHHEPPSYTTSVAFPLLPPDALFGIAAMLPPRALSHVARTSKRMLELFGDDSVWGDLAVRRWGLQPNRPSKCFGAVTWMAAYRNLAFRMRLPRGQFSKKHSVVFAKGRGSGVDLWCTIAHNHGCRTRQIAAPGGDPVSAVELRIIVQNVHNNRTYLDMAQVRVVCKPAGDGGSGAAAAPLLARASPVAFASLASSLDALPAIAAGGFPHVAALNGSSAERCCGGDGGSGGAPVVALAPLNFAVLSVLVAAPACEFETDFIARGLCLELPVVNVPDAPLPAWDACALCPCIRRTAARGAAAVARRSERGTVRAFFMDEARIFEHYDQLPGGCMVVRERRLDGL